MKIEIIKRKGQWYFRIKAANGKILAHSEKYGRKRDAEHAAELIATNGDIPIVYA